LDPPAKLFGDPAVMSRVQALAADTRLVSNDALPRRDFEAILSA
jgi:hypothetical protein